MPRCVRNYWVEVEADGYIRPIACGPKSKDGGIVVTFYIRSNGCVQRCLIVDGATLGNILKLEARTDEGKVVHVLQTTR